MPDSNYNTESRIKVMQVTQPQKATTQAFSVFNCSCYINQYTMQINSYPSRYVSHIKEMFPPYKNKRMRFGFGFFLKEPMLSKTAIKTVTITKSKTSRCKTV